MVGWIECCVPSYNNSRYLLVLEKEVERNRHSKLKPIMDDQDGTTGLECYLNANLSSIFEPRQVSHVKGLTEPVVECHDTRIFLNLFK
jgi:hypothetical protein